MDTIDEKIDGLEKQIQALENQRVDPKEGMSDIAIWDQSTWDSGCVFA